MPGLQKRIQQLCLRESTLCCRVNPICPGKTSKTWLPSWEAGFLIRGLESKISASWCRHQCRAACRPWSSKVARRRNNPAGQETRTNCQAELTFLLPELALSCLWIQSILTQLPRPRVGGFKWIGLAFWPISPDSQELLLRNEYLAAENRILKGQIKIRQKITHW